MKEPIEVKKEDLDMDLDFFKQEMDALDTKTLFKQEPFFNNHAPISDTPKQELPPNTKNTGINVKTELSVEDIKMTDDSDIDIESSTPEIVKQEAMELSPFLESNTKSQADIGSASILNAAKPKVFDINIKGEIISRRPTAESTNHLAKIFQKSGREYFYQCHFCTELKTTLLELLDHQSQVHKYTYRSRTYQNLELEPDIEDPNFYCKVCETTYPSITLFKKHLRMIHFIINKTARAPPTITPLGAIRTEKAFVVPDRDDPNNYCRACKKHYINQSRYHAHLAKFHDMPKFSRKEDVLPDIFDPNFYCRSCERSLSTKFAFRHHCLRLHNMTIPNEKDLPNVHDPAFHCKPCDNTFENKDTYWQHCREAHLITHFEEEVPKPFCDICNRKYANEYRFKRHKRLVHGDIFPSTTIRTPKLKNNLPPDINDPNSYCRSCDKKLSCKAVYQVHLAVYHDIYLPRKRSGAATGEGNSSKVIKKFHCVSCDKWFPTTPKYREHLELQHHVEGAATESKAHLPAYLPDPEDPNFYCRTCGKTKPTLENFRKHLKNIHHMKLAPLKQKRKKVHYVHSSEDDSTNEAPPQKPKFFHTCQVCGKKMKSKRRLIYHKKVIHRIERWIDSQDFSKQHAEVNPHKCDTCDISFGNPISLEHHVQEVHPIVSSPKEEQVDQGNELSVAQSAEEIGNSESIRSNHTPEAEDDNNNSDTDNDDDDHSRSVDDDLSQTLKDIGKAVDCAYEAMEGIE
ncbi:hypothetical protein HMPREF1544_02521 [Mucor circinelloides 1006PhL]|uniref:C2H2-type domain-containing protein n=1 Tax=Mucor circinelloides f. circinelloides (strain 1006PhL) TaxID=1220926 RepID=S2JJX2_MUCC1|nr:hypothetical protein HMPREF1544_02521 [Mucor circinelloides 1006PhL]